jgi:hypothetical protein
MKIHKNWKIALLLIALVLKAVILKEFSGKANSNPIFLIAGEVPEPGTILFLAIGGLWLRNRNRNK